jgi:hypothetical protein
MVVLAPWTFESSEHRSKRPCEGVERRGTRRFQEAAHDSEETDDDPYYPLGPP